MEEKYWHVVRQRHTDLPCVINGLDLDSYATVEGHLAGPYTDLDRALTLATLARYDLEPELVPPDEPTVIAIGRELWEVIATSEDGCRLIIPLNIVVLDPMTLKC